MSKDVSQILAEVFPKQKDSLSELTVFNVEAQQ